jgi:hypothetical protein
MPKAHGRTFDSSLDADALALLIGVEAGLFEGADAVEWAMRLLEEEASVSPDLVELATTGDDTTAFCAEVLRRVTTVPSPAPAEVTARLLACAFLLLQRGLPSAEVARRVGPLVRGLSLNAEQAVFVGSLRGQSWSDALAFFEKLDVRASRIPCLGSVPRYPSLRALGEAWSRNDAEGQRDAWTLGTLRLSQVSGDDRTATELLMVDAVMGLLSEYLEHGAQAELHSVSSMVKSLLDGVAALEARRGWAAQIDSPGLGALGIADADFRPRPGSGEWMTRVRLFAAHLQTDEVRRRLLL